MLRLRLRPGHRIKYLVDKLSRYTIIILKFTATTEASDGRLPWSASLLRLRLYPEHYNELRRFFFCPFYIPQKHVHEAIVSRL